MMGKRNPTIYTWKMRETAVRNAATKPWAQKLVSEVVDQADYYLKHIDTIYRGIPSEGIPRSTTMSTLNATDSVKRICPYCGIDVLKEVKGGLWGTNLIAEPWKVACPKCKSRFPSNDFALLYKRGLNEKGQYDRALAIKKNAEAVEVGEKDALINELFPDKDKGWMVDDGFGWSPADGTYGTLELSKWAPVAYYHHMFWYSQGEKSCNMVSILSALRQAYLYTGKEAYGIAGAVLLDRAADVYPEYDLKKVCLGFSASHGLGYNGKILGSIWEHYIAEELIKSYDAFYPIMGDERVIRYLSEKAERLPLKNPKTSAELIRKNAEDRIVREAFRALKNASIYGNFGMHQKVGALAAVALDSQPETDQMLAWLKAPSVVEYEEVTDPVYHTTVWARCKNSGGELLDKYIDEVDHDGFGGEISITYNKQWFINSLEIAEILSRYEKGSLNLFENPKFVKMFDTFVRETLGSGYSIANGDSGYAASIHVYPFGKEMLRGYYSLRDPRLAQNYYFYVGGDLSETFLDMFTDTEGLAEEIREVIAVHGERNFESENLTGYGLGILRGGEKKNGIESRYDTWMYYGRTGHAHAHLDMLQLGLDAYGFNYTPDLGYPEATAYQPNRWEWVKATISHNTVLVNGDSQKGIYTGKALHFDSSERVKLIDVAADDAYEETKIYRRTAVTIEASEGVVYTLDFFRVKGGDHHTYSFHTQSFHGWRTEKLNMVPQTDETGQYVGTYAGSEVPYGHDPNSTDVVRAEKTRYPRGYTWLTHVNRGTALSAQFSVDFQQTDFRKQQTDSGELHLKYTALNDWLPESVDLAVGYPPRKAINAPVPGLDYMLIQRSGQNLDTLFTSLLQPYKETEYIDQAEVVTVSVKEGGETAEDAVRAVKISFISGNKDYVVYATNNQVLYHIGDGDVCFDFRGFLGVYRVDEKNRNCYSYIHDGDVIGDSVGVGAYTGTVVDFTRELTAENSITVQVNETVQDAAALKDKYIYIDSPSERNTVYRIASAEKHETYVTLQLGNTTLIERFADKQDLGAGYLYTIAPGQTFRIPLSMIQGE